MDPYAILSHPPFGVPRTNKVLAEEQEAPTSAEQDTAVCSLQYPTHPTVLPDPRNQDSADVEDAVAQAQAPVREQEQEAA